jgi:ATP-dependent DNA helicase DinG
MNCSNDSGVGNCSILLVQSNQSTITNAIHLLSPTDILGKNGLLAQRVADFAPRVVQQQLSEAVAQTLEDKTTLVAEAGTGIGKTFAYLVPAMLSGQKVIISTGTKNLQDQLYKRDMSVVRDALAVPVSVALLKGRGNYLCVHRLALAEVGHYGSPEQADKIRRIRLWAGRTHNGDIAECSDINESDLVWAQVTSNSENCLGQECPSFEDCHLVSARRAAQAADIVVVNHHLLLSDMALKEEGFGELLPAADAFIIDEAHQLADVASSFFGQAISGNQLLELARDVETEFRRDINEGDAVINAAELLQKQVRDLRLAFGPAQQRAAWSQVSQQSEVGALITAIEEQLESLHRLLQPLAERSKGLDSCERRCSELLERFVFLTGETPDDHIHWFETHKRSFSLYLTPLSIADYFQKQMQALSAAWIFTSATLAVGNSFTHFTDRLGLTEVRTAQWDSPFDYANQALFYVPKGMPEPSDPSYTQAVIKMALPVLAASQGRAFLLFTSYRALSEAAALLQDKVDYPLYVQGEAPRDILLQRFRDTPHAVLLGTSSFWEGVDVRGDALSCVIIDKLPFASPGDPVLKARIDAMRKLGINAFMEYQLPDAVIALKQGAGRLIRDVHDRGVLMICDPRLLNKPYGRTFLESLPPMARTRDPLQVRTFFAPDTEIETNRSTAG